MTAASSVTSRGRKEPAGASREKEKAARREKLKKGSFVQSASTALNNRFSDMFKAFQYVDLDRSGRLSKKEIQRALDLWNIPITEDQLDMILAGIDDDADGGISYEEFVDKLARGTVAPAAMGKRGMQSLEAMGVDSQEMLAHQLGHGKVKLDYPHGVTWEKGKLYVVDTGHNRILRIED